MKEKLKTWNVDRGFTLIELVLYIALISIVLTSLVPFAWEIIGGGVKASAQQEVYSQARVISERIKYEIRNAKGINSVSLTSISLIADAPNDPTVIDLSAGNLRIKQGAAAAPLNSPDTALTSLTFTNYTSADNKTKNIQFVFTIDDNYAGTRQEYQVAPVTIESSAEVRSN